MLFPPLQAIDDDCNQTGQMLSALLNWPQVMNVLTLNFYHNCLNNLSIIIFFNVKSCCVVIAKKLIVC